MKNSWIEICRILAEKLDPIDYKVWIAPLKVVIEDSFINIYGDSFVLNRVRSRFSASIREAGASALGFSPELNFLSETCPLSIDAALEKNTEQRIAQPVSEISLAVKANQAEEFSEGPARSSEISATAQGLPLYWPDKPSQAPRWRFSFSDFVVGPCNELAHAASRSLCGQMRNMCNLLYLCSPPGLGKTHLMQASGRLLHENCNRCNPKIEYLTAEEFASSVRRAINNREMDAFKARYRSADVLLLENVHFLQKKEVMQEELLATVQAILENGNRVVFSSAFAPRDLRDMDAQLLSLMHSGLIAGIEKPDSDTCKRIIKQKAKVHQVALPEEVTEFLAEHINNDVRQIEGCLQKLILKARLLQCGINMQMACEVVREYVGSSQILDLEAIVRHICNGFGLSTTDLCSKSRKKEHVLARNTAFYLAHKHTRLTLEKIGSRFNRNHSTVIKGITSLEREISRETPVGNRLRRTISLIEKSANY